MKYTSFLLTLVAAGASAQQPGVAVNATSPQPPIAVTNSPPPQIIAVQPDPGTPRYIVETPPPPPPPLSARIVRRPQERRSAQSYVTPDDYPASALAQRAAGRVKVQLAVGRDGRVAGCAVLSSSGSAVLDSVACRLLVRRARFTPAMDSNGNPAVGTIVQQVEWRLPR